MKAILLFTLALMSGLGKSQPAVDNYTQAIQLKRYNSKKEIISETRAPLQASDTSLLDYYTPDFNWKLEAKIDLTPNDTVFQMPTSSGKTKPYKRYGIAKMQHRGKEFELSIYQNQNFLNDPELKDYLFIPFLDATNGETTYEGGRYIDLKLYEIKNGMAVIDFNLCYNPYCAYSTGYNCPVPPAENRLKIKIEAGEKKIKKSNH
jgi:uncharacterized protein (DUF1684 family)